MVRRSLIPDETSKLPEDSIEMMTLVEKNKVNDYLIYNFEPVHKSISFAKFRDAIFWKKGRYNC